MIYTIAIMVAGIIVGRVLNKRHKGAVSIIVLVSVCLLLFIMGVRVAADKNIIANLSNIGVEALIIFITLILSTLLVVKYATKWIDAKGPKEGNNAR